MNILLVNKFLFPNGGAETYIFKLGNYMKAKGHKVEYFGMEHERRCVGNRVNAYTNPMDFHKGSRIAKLMYPFKTIYSSNARRKIRLVLDDFNPDVVHLNNFNFQLTPSILYEIRKYKKHTGNKTKIVMTAHDSQLVCPNHMMQNPITKQLCTKCLDGKMINCVIGKCIHGSIIKSVIGMMEGYIYKYLRTYEMIDTIISPSNFLAEKLGTNLILKNKIVMLRNFVDGSVELSGEKEDYVLYFGRYSFEKGIGTLLTACKSLSEIPFVFAGNGPLEQEVNMIDNIKNVGFISGEQLQDTIQKARFTILSSEWYENCPFTVMESQMYGTPVLGSDLGGIPELIAVGKTGELFKSGDVEDLRSKIVKLWSDKERTKAYSKNCENIVFDTIDIYYEKIMKMYKYD